MNKSANTGKEEKEKVEEKAAAAGKKSAK